MSIKAISRKLDSSEYTVYRLIRQHAALDPQAPALMAPGRAPLSYIGLQTLIESTVDCLNELGYGRGDRIAVVLSNSAEGVAAVLAVSAGAICVPLNVKSAVSELITNFLNTRVTAVIALSNANPDVAIAAQTAGLPLIQLIPDSDAGAGTFRLSGRRREAASRLKGFSLPQETGVILQTSGTTSISKVVRISQMSLVRGAASLGEMFKLTAADRCLSVSPIFHMAGILPTTLTSFIAGGCIILPGEFNATLFASWVRETKPTWLFAVPTVHYSILDCAQREPDIARGYLRFLRSGAAAMPVSMINALETTFAAPVIEGYAMTECYPIAMNPMPPGQRKVGSVGIPIDVNLRVVRDDGTDAGRGVEGEILISGPNLFTGYENDPGASAASFEGTWFKSGDLGYLDGDGYLFITGRKKELISRGAEKIAPREVEEILLQYPGVGEAVVFGVKDDRLGEEVCALVRMAPRCIATSDEILDFVEGKLSPEKSPHFLFFVDAIPKSSAGKIQRAILSKTYSELLKSQTSSRSAETKSSAAALGKIKDFLFAVWKDGLKVTTIGGDDNFFQNGGESALAAILATRIKKELRIAVSARIFFEAPTVNLMSGKVFSLLESSGSTTALESVSLRTIRSRMSFPAPVTLQQRHFREIETRFELAYMFTYALTISGSLRIDVLHACLKEIVARHEVLRTVFRDAGGEQLQIILPAFDPKIPYLDVSGNPGIEIELARLVTDATLTPFDFELGPYWSSQLIRTHVDEHVLALTFSHTICDRWSLAVIVHEIMDLYCAAVAGKQSLLNDSPAQTSEYAVWQAQEFAAAKDARLNWWKRALDALPTTVSLSESRPDSGSKFPFHAHHTELRPELSALLRNQLAAKGLTFFPALLAAFAIAYSKFTGEDDFAFGVPSASRELPELAEAMGCFANFTLVRIRMNESKTFEDLARSVNIACLDAFENFVPLSMIGGLVSKAAITINLQSVGARSITLPGTATKIDLSTLLDAPVSIPEAKIRFNEKRFTGLMTRRHLTDIDMACILNEVDGGLAVNLWHREDKSFASPTVQTFWAEVIGVLEKAANDLSFEIGNGVALPVKKSA